ncbi:MAG TPA: hypothetical protein VMA36_13785 [Candidatus Limnocylindria bacterium]|jgi:hypothetical protein|nr:hypothetical protein [Candidatus Limnocylindria bacterium]
MIRLFSRGAATIVALLLAFSPAFATAQQSMMTAAPQAPATGVQGGNAGTQAGGGPSSDTGAGGATSGGPSSTTTTTDTTTTTTHSAFGVKWSWIAIGAVVVVVLAGLMAMSGNRTTTTTIRRE